MDLAMRHKMKIALVTAGLLLAGLAFAAPTTFWSHDATAANACTQSCQARFKQCMKSSGDRNACTDQLNSCRNQCFAGG
jgi:hypothetical protein